MTILSILNEISNTSSTKEKESILRREKDNIVLKTVFSAAYNRLISYHIKKIPIRHLAERVMTLDNAITCLRKLSNRELTGNAAVNYLSSLLSSLSDDDATVLGRIVDRDLRCGCSDSIASRVWPDVVPIFDVMLCDKDISRIKYPAIVQNKVDGARVNLFMLDDRVTAMSRNGKEFHLCNTLDASAKALMKDGECFDGELLVVKNGKNVDRQTGNGILNQANKGTLTASDAESIVMVVWDIVDTTSTIPYSKRFATLQERMNNKIDNRIYLIKSSVVNSQEDAMEFFANELSLGEEGAVIKNIDHVWVPKRSKDLCKLKDIQSADLRVVGTFEGTGKYAGMLGGLICQTADGLLEVRIGTGFSDEQRSLDQSYWNDAIVEVLYNMVIKSKGRDKACLFLPRLSPVGKRFDKSIANTFVELI